MSDRTVVAVDFEVMGEGPMTSVFVVRAITQPAQSRLDEIIDENEIPDYMRQGRHGVAVEHRYIAQWVDQLQGEGFNVEGF